MTTDPENELNGEFVSVEYAHKLQQELNRKIDSATLNNKPPWVAEKGGCLNKVMWVKPGTTITGTRTLESSLAERPPMPKASTPPPKPDPFKHTTLAEFKQKYDKRKERP